MGETPVVRSTAEKEGFRAACDALDLLLRLRAKIVELLADDPARDDP